MMDLFNLNPKPKKKEEEETINPFQFATTLAKAKTSKPPETGETEQNPYAFWKAPVIPGKGGKGGLPLDRAVALAGMLASSFGTNRFGQKEFGGRLGEQLTQYAMEGSKAHEAWEAQRKAMGLEERKVAAEEARIAKPTETEILSGIAGQEPREKFIAGEQARRAPHPSEIALNQARIDVEKETQRLKQEEIKLVPEEFKMKQTEHQTRLGVMDLEKRRLDLEIEKLGLEKNLLAKGTTKETIQAIKSVNQTFDSFVQSWMTKHVYTPDDEKSNYLKNAELAASVQSHIAGIKTFTNAPEATEKSVRYWFSQVDKEFDRPTLATGFRPLGVGITGAGPQAIAEQGARRRYYVKAAADMLRTSETQSSDLYESLVLWSMKAGYSDQDVTNLLSSYGFNAKQQTSIINKAATRF